MMSEFLIQDKDNKLLFNLSYKDCLTAKRDFQINGFHTLEIALDLNHEATKHLEKYNRIMFFDQDKNKWYEFVVTEVKQTVGQESVFCESSIYDMLSQFIQFVDVTGNTPINGLTKILNTAYPKSNWNPGTSDILGSFYMQRTKKSLKETVFAWANNCGGILSERIQFYNGQVVRYLDIKSNIGGDYGKVIYDDRDLIDIELSVPSDTNYTLAFGYGKSESIGEDGESKPITFSDVVWSTAKGDPVNKPVGQIWVSLPDIYKNTFGIIDTDGIRQHRATIWKEDGVEIPEHLLQRTYQALLDNVTDKTQYKTKVSDLNALGITQEEMNVGDTIGIVVTKMADLKLKAKIYRFTENLLDPTQNDYELGSVTKDITSDMIDDSELLKNVNDRLNGITKTFFKQSILNAWNDEINTESGFLIYGDPIDGLVCLNAPTPEQATKATRMKGGSLQIANRKITGNWNWTTVLTGDGIIANAIFAGIIAGERFDLDLDTGTVMFGARNKAGIIVDPELKWSADGLEIKLLKKYSTTDEVAKIIGEKGTEITGLFDKKLTFYPTKTEMSSAISLSAESLNISFNKILTGYTTKTDTAAAIGDAVDQAVGETDLKLKKYPTILEMNSAISLSAEKLNISFSKTLTSYSTKTEVITAKEDAISEAGEDATTKANNALADAKADTTSKLMIYPTKTEMTSAISLSAENLNISFGKTLTGYSTKTELITAKNDVINVAAGDATTKANNALSSAKTDTNKKLASYPTKTEMSTSINASAAGLTIEINKKVNDSDFGTKIQANYQSVQISWNKISDYISFEYGSMNIYASGTKLLMSLSNSGMKFYRDDNTNFIGQIVTNSLNGFPSKKGLDFDLDMGGTFMTWAVRQYSGASTYTMMLSYSRETITNLPAGLSISCDLDMRWYDIKNCNIVKDGGGVRQLKFYKYNNDPGGYVEVNTGTGNFGIDAWPSDGRLKENIASCQNSGIEAINSLKVRTYDIKGTGHHKSFGLIAQELESVNPDFIFKIPQRNDAGDVIDELMQIRQGELIPVLIKAIQELSDNTSILDQRLSLLEPTDNIAKMRAKMPINQSLEEVPQYSEDIKFNIKPNIRHDPSPIEFIKNDDGTIEFL